MLTKIWLEMRRGERKGMEIYVYLYKIITLEWVKNIKLYLQTVKYTQMIVSVK